MIVPPALRQALIAWSRNPTNRNRARLVGALARMDQEMHRRGMRDVFYEDAGMSCPPELRKMLELYKRREEQLAAA